VRATASRGRMADTRHPLTAQRLNLAGRTYRRRPPSDLPLVDDANRVSQSAESRGIHRDSHASDFLASLVDGRSARLDSSSLLRRSQDVSKATIDREGIAERSVGCECLHVIEGAGVDLGFLRAFREPADRGEHGAGKLSERSFGSLTLSKRLPLDISSPSAPSTETGGFNRSSRSWSVPDRVRPESRHTHVLDGIRAESGPQKDRRGGENGLGKPT
jgi:hypothetical protein